MQTRPTTFDICHFASIFMKCVVSDKKRHFRNLSRRERCFGESKKRKMELRGRLQLTHPQPWLQKRVQRSTKAAKIIATESNSCCWITAESQFIQTGGEWGGKLTNTQLMNPNPKRYHESVKHPTGVHLLTAFSLCSFYYIFPSQKFSPTATWPVTWHQQSVALSILKISEV